MKDKKYACLVSCQQRYGDLSQLGQYASLARQLVHDFLNNQREFPGKLEHSKHWVLIGNERDKLERLARCTSKVLDWRGIKGVRIEIVENTLEVRFGTNGDSMYFISVDSYYISSKGHRLNGVVGVERAESL